MFVVLAFILTGCSNADVQSKPTLTPMLTPEASSTELTRIIEINPEVQDGVIHVAAKGASCDSHPEHATCHIHQQDWGIPVKITEAGEGALRLSLSGD